MQSSTAKVEEMRVRRREREHWMSHHALPEELKERIRRYDQYKWQDTRGLDQELVICDLPEDLRSDVKRHLCLALLMRVPIFEKMEEWMKNVMCDRLKPVIYTKKSYVVREGDPVNEMLFIRRGRLLSMISDGGRTGFFDSSNLDVGDFCGEELLTWALDPRSSSHLPSSTRTVQSLTEVKAFALMPHDLKFVATQFRRFDSRELQRMFRYYSLQWRTWAAYFIQAAWRRHCKRKLESSLEQAGKDVLAGEGGSAPSLGSTIQVLRVTVNALGNLRLNARTPQRATLLNWPKPAEPDFSSDDD